MSKPPTICKIMPREELTPQAILNGRAMLKTWGGIEPCIHLASMQLVQRFDREIPTLKSFNKSHIVMDIYRSSEVPDDELWIRDATREVEIRIRFTPE